MSAIPDKRLVASLVSTQFPEYSTLSIRAIEPGGWDNLSFRLGNELLVKLPRDERYAMQPEREHRILRALADVCPLPIPNPVALGRPSDRFAFSWSILEWIEGDTVADVSKSAPNLPLALAEFLLALHQPAPPGAPVPGLANFWRGGGLSSLSGDFERALASLPQGIDRSQLAAIWQVAVTSEWRKQPCWVHGDIAPSNLLQRCGELAAVIDFGLAAAGDPACDLAIAWLALEGSQRRSFLLRYGMSDSELLHRARAWAAWKAVLVIAGMSQPVAGYREPARVIRSILEDPLPGDR